MLERCQHCYPLLISPPPPLLVLVTHLQIHSASITPRLRSSTLYDFVRDSPLFLYSVIYTYDFLSFRIATCICSNTSGILMVGRTYIDVL